MSGVLIVTGASRGIGASVARLGAAAGYGVCVNYRDAADKAAEVVESIAAAGGEAVAVQADVASEPDVVWLFEEVDGRLGRVTALVSNAGILGGAFRVDECRADVLAGLWATNVTGCFPCAREAVRRMSTRHGGHGGAIVNVSSLAGKALIVMAGAVRKLRRRGSDAEVAQEPPPPYEPRPLDAAAVLALTCVYVAVMQLRLVGFAVATAAFLFLASGLLMRFRPRTLPVATAIGLIMGYGCQYLFTRVSVVDLPAG